jgi:hypothetical protein
MLLLSPSIITIMDDKIVETKDMGSNYFLEETHIGKVIDYRNYRKAGLKLL